eukprot:13702034-Heterocapsa_arctica.AAC.1
MSIAAVKGSNQLQCISIRTVKRAQARKAPPNRCRVPVSDMEHLEYLLDKYVETVGLARAFDMGDYKL